MKLLVDAVTSVSDWHNLGLHLDIATRKLKEIDRIYRVDGEERIKAEMFDVWLKSCPDASWHKLVTALNEIDEKKVAKEVESRYCKELPGNLISYSIIAVCRTCHNNLLTTSPQDLMPAQSALMLVPHMLLLVIIVLVRNTSYKLGYNIHFVFFLSLSQTAQVSDAFLVS